MTTFVTPYSFPPLIPRQKGKTKKRICQKQNKEETSATLKKSTRRRVASVAAPCPSPPAMEREGGVAPRNCQQKKARALERGRGGVGGSCARGKQGGGEEGQAVQLEGRDQKGADDLARQGRGVVEGGFTYEFPFPCPKREV